ncbi:MAG: cell division protein FtsQ/DivIB, partial [Pseudomonadota bacterium]|nr:cell division protein FtsQ/DivIB [Pseudomonadota bacterium]
VRRVWPDSVRVRFREREAFGHWGQDGELVDVHGRRFRPARVLQATPLPRLAGPDGQERTLIRTFAEARALLATVDLQIDRLMMDERRAWWITLATGVEIRLGRAEFSRRLQRFVDVYPQALAPRMERIAAVDLRYGNGFAVRWAQPPATPRPPKATADGRRGTARGVHTGTRLTPTPASAGRRPGRNAVYVETQ